MLPYVEFIYALPYLVETTQDEGPETWECRGAIVVTYTVSVS